MPRLTQSMTRPKKRPFCMLGLMSGTSMDGIDVAYLETDGGKLVRPGAFATYPYRTAFRKKLRAALGKKKAPKLLEAEFTRLHAKAVLHFLKNHRLKAEAVDAIGFHGHTLYHAPEKRQTLQMGDGKLLAQLTSIPVVYDFRSDDVKAGGQGAPLVPAYHRALAAALPRPVAFLNLGGVANITLIGKKDELLAFDTGPGNALLDDWVLHHKGKAFDAGGKLAAKGKVDGGHVRGFMQQAYFLKAPPKSLDRDMFAPWVPNHLNAADGAATLAAMSAVAVGIAFLHLPQKPKQLIVCGGGRHNAELMRLIKHYTKTPVVPVEKLKLNGDAIEAEAFAYLAARVVLGLPISFAGTTGRKTR